MDNIQIFCHRTWGTAGHLDGRLHDQPTVPAHPPTRPTWPPSPSHAATAAPAATGKTFHSKSKLVSFVFEQKHNLCELQFKAIFNPAPSTAAAATVEPVR